MPSFQLIVRRGPKAGEKFPLKTQTVIIGRDSTADIHLNDPEVSRNHCRLILDETYYLQDLGSTNGTFVDGTRLAGEPVSLNNGQIIQLGSNVTLLYQQLSDDNSVMATMFAINPDDAQTEEDSTALYDYESDPELLISPSADQSYSSRPEPEPEPEPEPVYNYREPEIAYSPPPSEPTPDPATESAAFEEAKQKQRRTYIIIAVVVVILFLCCVCGLIIGGVYYADSQGLFDIPTAIAPFYNPL